MTFTFIEIVALIAAMAVVACAIAVMRLSRRLTRTACEIEHTAYRITALTPTAQGVLEHCEAELNDFRTLTRKTSEIVDDVQTISGKASAATAEFVRVLEGGVAGRYGAIVADARAGLAALRRMRGGNEPDAMNRTPGTFGLADR